MRKLADELEFLIKRLKTKHMKYLKAKGENLDVYSDLGGYCVASCLACVYNYFFFVFHFIFLSVYLRERKKIQKWLLSSDEGFLARSVDHVQIHHHLLLLQRIINEVQGYCLRLGVAVFVDVIGRSMIERLPDCGGCCPKDSEYELWQKRCIDNEKKLTPYLMEVAFHLI
ncbi:hypothetical protein QVD17_16878 [Tagetes erecta]|uniref:Uncharacterized protein n=1 Tax=Tagetes erecta TaxID=13708 RepID=A0AAD8KVM8_TARER|nr:hypothetical protein QVD17_16878 [Tagetes erecta]